MFLLLLRLLLPPPLFKDGNNSGIKLLNAFSTSSEMTSLFNSSTTAMIKVVLTVVIGLVSDGLDVGLLDGGNLTNQNTDGEGILDGSCRIDGMELGIYVGAWDGTDEGCAEKEGIKDGRDGIVGDVDRLATGAMDGNVLNVGWIVGVQLSFVLLKGGGLTGPGLTGPGPLFCPGAVVSLFFMPFLNRLLSSLESFFGINVKAKVKPTATTIVNKRQREIPKISGVFFLGFFVVDLSLSFVLIVFSSSFI
mmetsp:Transcript_9660/g.14340  ORF Transcript_9660/g.14340 Transcript_9660/m.14340 type:complete len:249 (+) Transcript_9660:1791-2537(+)